MGPKHSRKPEMISCEYGIFDSLKLWNFETAKPRNFETKELWHQETEYQETLKLFYFQVRESPELRKAFSAFEWSIICSGSVLQYQRITKLAQRSKTYLLGILGNYHMEYLQELNRIECLHERNGIEHLHELNNIEYLHELNRTEYLHERNTATMWLGRFQFGSFGLGAWISNCAFEVLVFRSFLAWKAWCFPLDHLPHSLITQKLDAWTLARPIHKGKWPSAAPLCGTLCRWVWPSIRSIKLLKY